MAKGTRQKLKLILLAQLLLEQTDEEHPLSTGALIAALERQGVAAERKSIYSDMEYLALSGMDVQLRRDGGRRGWFVGERQFQLPELKLLVDAVQSSRFLSQRKSRELIRKLERLTSVHQAQELRGKALSGTALWAYLEQRKLLSGGPGRRKRADPPLPGGQNERHRSVRLPPPGGNGEL